MDVLRFIGWWWNRRDSPEKTLIVFFFWLLVTLPWMFFYGFNAILIFFGGLLLTGAVYLLIQIYKALRDEWNKFNTEREAEAQQIVNKLAGTTSQMRTAEDILEKLRARRNTTV